MKSFFFFFAILVTSLSFAQSDRRERARGAFKVYCDEYVTSNGIRGYSLYRRYDRADIGNAVFFNFSECDSAAVTANEARTGIVCGRYHNSRTGRTDYSVYRISDLKDLGNAAIPQFSECQDAVRFSRAGIFCSTYNKDGKSGYSLYSILDGSDIGRNYFYTMNSCLNELRYR